MSGAGGPGVMLAPSPQPASGARGDRSARLGAAATASGRRRAERRRSADVDRAIVPRMSSPWRAAAAALALALLAAGCAAGTSGAPGATRCGSRGPPAATRTCPPLSREVLPNGLKLIIQDHRAAGHRRSCTCGSARACATRRPTGSATPTSRSTCCSRARTSSGPATSTAPPRASGGRNNAVTSFDYTNYYVIVPSERTERRHRAPRRDGVPLDVRPRGDQARARGHLRGGAHRGGQPAHRHRAPALRPRLRRQPVRPPGPRHARHHERGHAGEAPRLQPPVLHAGEHVAGGGRARRPGRGARHRDARRSGRVPSHGLAPDAPARAGAARASG